MTWGDAPGEAWKILDSGGRPCHGGLGVWPPPGEWMTVDGLLVPCKHGIHLCQRQDVVVWLGPEIWEAEYQGEVLIQENKLVVRSARRLRRLEAWTLEVAVAFAIDCAEHVLLIFERTYPQDDRPRQAIAAARAAAYDADAADAAYADAARAADPARAAAYDAARAAERAWQTERLMEILYPPEIIP